jgi:hypothetical protein
MAKTRRNSGSGLSKPQRGDDMVVLYEAIKEENEDAANLPFLWSLLESRDLWYGLFVAACEG